jgi:release factor glutamine methyltransferase
MDERMPGAGDDRSIGAARRDAVARLTAAGLVDAEVDADLLMGHVLGLSRGGVQAKVVMGADISEADAAELASLVGRRVAREPLQHITGRAPFRSLDLLVGPGVLVPRPETEMVAQLAIDALRSMPDAEPIAVDLGTGSGAIALSLATEVPHARVYGVELSPEAMAWARRNLDEVGGAVTLVEGDLADALPELDGQVSVVVSNPPYVPAAAIPADPEVHLHDPVLALYGGDDGLDVIRAVSTRAHAMLRPGGSLVVEHFETQSAQIAQLLVADGWRAVSHHRDLTMRDRATTAVR